MLDKRLKLGGLQVGGPRTSQNSARFRVANNVFQTSDDYLVPRFHATSQFSAFVGEAKLAHISQYEDKPLLNTVSTSDTLETYGPDYLKRPSAPIPFALGASGELPANGVQYVEKLGNQYSHIPGKGLFKYDGVQAYRAGSPLPYISCAEYNTSGTTWIRVIQHYLDFQGNTINSGYVQFPATPDASSNVNIRVDKGATDLVGSDFVEPKSRSEMEKFDGTFSEFFFKSTTAGAVDSVQKEITFTTSGNHVAVVGAYIFISTSHNNNNGLGETSLCIALQIKSFTATTITLNLLNVKYMDTARNWKIGSMDPTHPILTAFAEGVNYWLSVWTSTSATAAYVLKGVIKGLYNSSTSTTYGVNVSAPTDPWLGADTIVFSIAPIMADFYDVTTSKHLFPKIDGPRCFSTYGDLGLISYSNEVYFSDTTLGGAFEMTSGTAFIAVGEEDDGEVQSVCGNAEFMLVSRQYKNYYLSGSLPTANYRVQEITETSLGCYSNESSRSVANKIIFINKQGVWALYPGARCEELSLYVKGFFDNFANTHSFAEEDYFHIDDYPTFADYSEATPSDQWLRIKHDVNRKLLFFVTKGNGQGRILVLNLNNGEFYTWSGMLDGITGTPDLKDITFIDGSYWVTLNGTSIALGKENRSVGDLYPYIGNHPVELEPTWFTAGEPSLEKKLQQLKMWGIINADCDISHKVDWKDTAVSDGQYLNADTVAFSHKKRFESENFLSVSAGIKITSRLVKFELEGIEIEWSPLQDGMKR